jgi:hypothetical protein
MTTAAAEMTVLRKAEGILTKKIMLMGDGSVHSDGSECLMSRGAAERVRIGGVNDLAALIKNLQSNEALALGRLRLDLPETVELVTRRKFDGATVSGIITRTSEYLCYRSGEPAYALLDFDSKGMPVDVARRLDELGGYWSALISIIPEFAGAAHLIRQSTSAGLYRCDTGETLLQSGGLHVYVAVADGSDIERFLHTLHDRCWLAGFGWRMIGAGGRLLDRSIVDRVVGSPERLVFEGPPVLEPPLAQNLVSRYPIARQGELLDTVIACPPLTIVENARLRGLKALENERLGPAAAKAREDFIVVHSSKISARAGVSISEARRMLERQCAGVLTPGMVLPFDDPQLAGVTVAYVLADPNRFEGETLADPLEGPQYGNCKAKIMRGRDGNLWIHSFAHGDGAFELRLDADHAVKALNAAPAEEVGNSFIRLALTADLTPVEIERLRDIAHSRGGIGKRPLDAMLKAAKETAAAKNAASCRERQLAQRQDRRPFIEAPVPDAEWLPQMTTINEVLGKSEQTEPPTRGANHHCNQLRSFSVPALSQLSKAAANGSPQSSSFSAAKQLLLVDMTEEEVSEMIERHIEYYVDTPHGYRSVHLHPKFVRHYLKRDDGALPTATTVAQLPIVLHDGLMLTGPGLHRPSGIILRVPDELLSLLPRIEDCTPGRVTSAMRFLTDEWLCDVATEYPGKCIIIACALTIIERAILPERPAFFVVAGQRGGGKTTTIHMISKAVLGIPACAAAWSTEEDERRKALLSYFSAGLPLLAWDNITRGSTISCPHIEKALTNEFYSDRVLGVSEYRLVLSSTVHVFTGNNISPRGDMASRSLSVRLAVSRPDPENREFKHPDPLAWTDTHRGEILAALYTILLGNPRRNKEKGHPPAETRFKDWWDIVGSAIEFAAKQAQEHTRAFVADEIASCPPQTFGFKALFLDGEIGEEQTSSLATVVEILHRRWGTETFQAREVAAYAGQAETDSIAFKAALELASGTPIKIISSPVINWRLQAICDAPVMVGTQLLVLKYTKPNRDGRGGGFCVNTIATAL